MQMNCHKGFLRICFQVGEKKSCSPVEKGGEILETSPANPEHSSNPQI